MSSVTPDRRRLTFIDETRALAIMAMIMMHFGPGAIARVPFLQGVGDFLLVVGRFATPAFITVFGVTAGFVYGERFATGETTRARARIYRRTAIVLLAAVILTLPRYVTLYGTHALDPGEAPFYSYSVLSYYVLGLATLPWWLDVVAKRPMVRAPLAALGLWIAHVVVYAVWPHDPALGPAEFVRMHLVSGSYPYFAMTGVALAALPVGVLLRQAHREHCVDRTLGRVVLPTGLLLAAIGIGWGLGLGELTLQAVLDAVPKAPARPWYYLMFGGMTFVLLTVVAFVRNVGGRTAAYVLYPLGLTGQASLEVYTGHAYVVPGLNWLDGLAPVTGGYRVALALAIFSGFITIVLLRRHRKRTV